MHPNAQTLQRFYTAFAQLDPATMAACYAPDARFDDEAFSLKGREQIGGMWRMLCTATQKPGAAEHWKLEFSGIEADATAAKAHWEAHYLFSATQCALPAVASASMPLNSSFQCSAAPGFWVAVHSMRHMPPICSRPFREKASSSNVASGA